MANGTSKSDAVRRLAALIDQIVTERNVSLNSVALRAGITEGYLSRIRRGQVINPPSPNVLKKLAPVLRVPYHELLRAAGYLDDDEDLEAQHLMHRARHELSPDDYEEVLAYVRFRLDRARVRQNRTQS